MMDSSQGDRETRVSPKGGKGKRSSAWGPGVRKRFYLVPDSADPLVKEWHVRMIYEWWKCANEGQILADEDRDLVIDGLKTLLLGLRPVLFLFFLPDVLTNDLWVR